jgi:2-polyprenyl-6-methoxyphenol hydroxylase-like FAD-dependent oxidoreductase
MCGLAAAMMLADDGHEVTVLERDPAPAPPDPASAFTDWERRSIAQFGLAHLLLGRGGSILAKQVPSAHALLADNGGYRFNLVEYMLSMQPDAEITADDDRFAYLTGRRSTLEWAMATAADRHDGVTVRRGEAIAGFTTGSSVIDGVPHVSGLRLASGEEITGDLVVDATGRRSPTADWLADIGAVAPIVETEDSGFAYFGRYFRSDDGSVPAYFGPGLAPFDTFSLLTIPADNGTWSVTLYSLADDKELRRFRDPDVLERVVQACPLHAHWLDGEPISEMASMVGVVDRHSRFVVDGLPCATGVLSVADASSCTNPSQGRGITLGLIHVEMMRATIADHLDDPAALAFAFDEVTEREMRPWHDTTNAADRRRVEVMRANIAGEVLPPDPAEQIAGVLGVAASSDPVAARVLGEIMMCLALPDEVFARPGVLDHVLGLAGTTPVEPLPGPNREELLQLIG